MKFTFAENITLLNPVKIMEIFLSFSKSSFWKYKKKGKIRWNSVIIGVVYQKNLKLE